MILIVEYVTVIEEDDHVALETEKILSVIAEALTLNIGTISDSPLLIVIVLPSEASNSSVVNSPPSVISNRVFTIFIFLLFILPPNTLTATPVSVVTSSNKTESVTVSESYVSLNTKK